MAILNSIVDAGAPFGPGAVAVVILGAVRSDHHLQLQDSPTAGRLPVGRQAWCHQADHQSRS